MAKPSLINTIFLMFGGVATQRLDVAVSRVLIGASPLSQIAAQVAGTTQVASATEVALRDLAADLELGRVDATTFCQRVLELGRVEMDGGAAELWTRSRQCLSPTPHLQPFLDEVNARYSLWLVSDYPRAWLSELLDAFGLRPFFSAGRVLYPAELRLPGLMPYLIPAMLSASGVSLEQCLFVDARPANTTSAIRNGLNAAVFVDVARLRRNLVLRSML